MSKMDRREFLKLTIPASIGIGLFGYMLSPEGRQKLYQADKDLKIAQDAYAAKFKPVKLDDLIANPKSYLDLDIATIGYIYRREYYGVTENYATVLSDLHIDNNKSSPSVYHLDRVFQGSIGGKNLIRGHFQKSDGSGYVPKDSYYIQGDGRPEQL